MKFECVSCKFRSFAVSTLDDDQLSLLTDNCLDVSFKKGDIIFKQGAFSLNIAYLKTGLVKLHMLGDNNQNQIIKLAKAPDYIGIPTTLGDKVNQYSATAIEDCSVCFISIDTFKILIETNKEFAYEIILKMCKNELANFKNCFQKTQKNSRGLVADALLNFATNIYEKPEFTIPLSRIEFAHLISSSREQVCRVLSEFHKDNIINLKGKRIEILDKNRIIKIAQSG